MRYTSVCVAGTFDGIHVGHEVVLRKAFTVGKRVLIGLTSDAYVKVYKPVSVAPYATRLVMLTSWITAHDWQERATIVPIDDPFEPAVSSKDVDALVVSEETKGRGEALNEKRLAKGLSALTLVVVPLQKTEAGEKISSSTRRTMPDSLRDQLTEPLGSLLTTLNLMHDSFVSNRDRVIVTVGDLTTKTLLEAGVTPQLMIVDNKVGRIAFPDLQPIFAKRGFPKQMVASGPGFISNEAMGFISRFPKDPMVLEVEGEEDLLTLPAIITAPLHSVVYYGQPNRGIVEVVVTEEKRHEANKLLARFIS